MLGRDGTRSRQAAPVVNQGWSTVNYMRIEMTQNNLLFYYTFHRARYDQQGLNHTSIRRKGTHFRSNSRP